MANRMGYLRLQLRPRRIGSDATKLDTSVTILGRRWSTPLFLCPVAALEAPMELGAFWSQSWPSTTVIRCRRSANPPEAHQRRTAERLKAAWQELDTGHYPMLSQPEELTRLLL